MQKDNPIPARLKAARKKAKISQKELGLRIGIDESSASGRMNHYEKGRHIPDISALRRMAEEFDVPLHFFFCDDEVSAELICLMHKLSDSEKVNLIKTLKHKVDD